MEIASDGFTSIFTATTEPEVCAGRIQIEETQKSERWFQQMNAAPFAPGDSSDHGIRVVHSPVCCSPDHLSLFPFTASPTTPCFRVSTSAECCRLSPMPGILRHIHRFAATIRSGIFIRSSPDFRLNVNIVRVLLTRHQQSPTRFCCWAHMALEVLRVLAIAERPFHW